MAKKKTLEDMRQEAYRREDNLASDIDELLGRVHPKNAVTRWKNEIVGSVKSFSAAGDEKSSAMPLAIAGGVIGVIVLGAGITAAVVLPGGDDDDSGQSVKKAPPQTAKSTPSRGH